MRFAYFMHALSAIVITFQITFISEIICLKSDLVLGCTFFPDDARGVVVKCTQFNTSFTQTLLPNNTKVLQIYKVKNLPTDKPLVPKLSMLNKLDLLYNDIYNITKITFEGLENLLHLKLTGNYIRNIPPDAFTNTLKLRIVDLSDNFLISFKSVVPSLQPLKNLRHLYLSSNKLLRFIKDNDFVALENSTLESIDVSLCLIEIIESNAFKPLKSMVSLNISSNPLTSEGLINISMSLQRQNLQDLAVREMTAMSYLPCGFLSWLQSTFVVSLDLSENRFICFPSGNYRYLKHLTLNKCVITDILLPFSGMPNLEYVEIKEHGLSRIDREFESNTRLKVLDLSYFTGLKDFANFEISDYAFENQNQLSTLRLRELPIKTKIRRYMFHGLMKLDALSISKCRIPSVDCYAFETLNNLRYLDLSNNAIFELSNCSFYGLVNLEQMNLARNTIAFMNEVHPFEFMPKLEYLNLRSNKITKLSAGIFKKLNNIGILLLDDNIIHSWQQSIFTNKSNLTFFELKENAITHFTKEMISDISRVNLIDFSGNPINCSHCSIFELQKWMINNSHLIRYIDKAGAYVCNEPETIFGIDIVKTNLTIETHHCFPEEKDIVKIVCTIFVPIVCIALISLVVWYRWSWNIKYCVFLMQLNTKKYRDYVDSTRFIFDAYVFHSESDVGWIRQHLIPSLENGNPELRLCLPDRNFDVGVAILDNIISAIDNSRSTIIVLSNNCLNCRWCLYNIQLAQNMLVEKTRSGLIIILLEDIQKDNLEKDIQYVLRTRTCIWWTDNAVGQKLFWERLRLAIMRPTDRGVSAHIT